MLIKNACIENNEELKCIRIEDGKFKEIRKDLEPYAQEEVMDLEGKLVNWFKSQGQISDSSY